jgi:DNA polymerase-3 subunit chi
LPAGPVGPFFSLGATMSACTFYDTEPSLLDRRLFEIVETIYNRKEKAVIFAQTAERAAALDRTLWILKQESFIPHEVYAGPGSEPTVPVVIVTGEWNPIGADNLVVDGHCSLDFALKFKAIHEFVNRSSQELHQTSRERFREYRARGIAVEHLKKSN